MSASSITSGLMVTTLAAAAFCGAACAETTSVSMPQVSTADRKTAATGPSEISAPRSTATSHAAVSPDQVGDAKKGTVASPPNISNPNGGYSIQATAIGGKDSCDVANAQPPQPETCQNRIETRTADFSKPTSVPVTAEGQLLLLAQSHASLTPEDVARRANNGPGDPQVDALAGAANVVATAVASPAPGGVTVTSTNPTQVMTKAH